MKWLICRNVRIFLFVFFLMPHSMYARDPFSQLVITNASNTDLTTNVMCKMDQLYYNWSDITRILTACQCVKKVTSLWLAHCYINLHKMIWRNEIFATKTSMSAGSNLKCGRVSLHYRRAYDLSFPEAFKSIVCKFIWKIYEAIIKNK